MVHPYSIFSDCFAAMAFAQYYKATKEEWAKELALKTFDNIEKRYFCMNLFLIIEENQIQKDNGVRLYLVEKYYLEK